MSEWLLSVGLDVGTTSTQLVVSQLLVENNASGFTVPEMVIAERNIRYKSPVHFTPLIGQDLVDGEGIRRILEQEYARAGIQRQDVDTGAVIITGETSRKENARTVLGALSDFAGDFVVATAGPDLESVLAAKGAGAVQYSEDTGKRVLHMDIGGGTANLALIESGKITATTCLNVGGRLLKLDAGRVCYVSPVLAGLTELQVGDRAPLHALEQVADTLVQALEMAAGLREVTALLEQLTTKEAYGAWKPPAGDVVISFSGGVADCIETEKEPLEFGDIGPILGQAIRKSRLCQKEYRLGEETIRATVIGAGCHSAQLSGSTVFYKDSAFPLKNMPVVTLSETEQAMPPGELAGKIRQQLGRLDTDGVLALPGLRAPDYSAVKTMAGAIVEGFAGKQVLVAVEKDMAKALGQAMALELPQRRSCFCIDSVKLQDGSFLDVGAPVGPALPVVVKTLVMGN